VDGIYGEYSARAATPMYASGPSMQVETAAIAPHKLARESSPPVGAKHYPQSAYVEALDFVKKYTNYALGTLTTVFHLTTLPLRKHFTHSEVPAANGS